MKKRGQATIFVIISLLLLLGASFFFFAQTESIKQIIPDVYLSEKVPTDFDPVKTYVEDCAYETAVSGLKLAGEHGGYISFNDPDINTETFDIRPDVTESDAVLFSPSGDLAVAYWWYLKSENDCTGKCLFDSKMPDLRDTENSLEKQLERYIRKNIGKCLNDFKSFESQGIDVKALGDIKVDVVFSELDTVILIDYPIEASKEKQAKLTKFYTKVPINMQKIFDLGREIADMQNRYRFFEKAVINLIGSFSALDSSKIPPFSDMRVGWNTPVRWLKSDVKKKVDGILMSYMPLFQVDGTRNYERNIFDSQLKQTLYDYFIIPIADDYYSDLEASFTYLDFWPSYFDLNCNGELCEPESANSPFFNLLGIQRYRFSYDISFPVLVELNEPEALNNQGYSFKYFIEANIRNNDPLDTDFNPLNVTGQADRTYLCDYRQRQSGDVLINAMDRIEGKPVPGATVTYTVAGESCFIGTTAEDGTLKAKFPTGAVGGVVTLLKEDYLMQSELFDASGEEANLEVDLLPLEEKKVIVRKKKISKSGDSWIFIDEADNLDAGEEAFVTLTRKGTMNEQEYSTAAVYKPGEESRVSLAPGDYEISVNLLSYKDILIPEKHVKEDGGLFGEDVEYTLPEVRFTEDSPFPSGNIKINATLTQSDIESYDTIVFYVLSLDIESVPENSREITDLEELNRFDEYSGTYKGSLLPRFFNS